jgi:CheY-like chemotaxis protein
LVLVETGAEALQECARARPDLVVIDMHLLDMNGLELIAQLRQTAEGQGLRCIALSADGPAEVVATALAAGFEAYWLKPIDVARVKAALQQVLGAAP